MIPTVNQTPGRAGPAATQTAEVISSAVTRAQPEVPPVAETAVVDRDMLPDRWGTGRRDGTSTTSQQDPHSTTEEIEAPLDRALFQAKVIALLTEVYGDDACFQRALKLGTVTVRAIEDQPAPEMRPELSHAIYCHGAAQAHEPSTALDRPAEGLVPVNNAVGDFIAWWPKQPAPD
ncbi:hypothetical protein JWJ88_01380 [Paracoccus methylovorus]|uniref:DUF3306 domain-containing protein n=1 Tax=Paracoccus methylovorus TaxID=2812658 RepID=A0ABX7JGI1_9RHOB|nr:MULTISPECIES: hypothetical protein [Paracoccus]QRZ13342.1 hypothetical protein JWJ88_01380 [Paracoccus methylovorus]